MMRLTRTRLTLSTAVAALLVPLTAGLVSAQSAGFAIEVGRGPDSYTPFRVGARVFGTVAEPAAGFVRGCRGHVLAEADGAAFEVTSTMDTLAFTAAGDGLVSMVLGTPDGLYRCAQADEAGFVSTTLASVGTGRYMVWLGADEGASIDARLFASERGVSSIELFGLNVSRLGEPRNGRFVYAASLESERQDLVLGGRLHAEDDLQALSPENCWGYSRLDAADAVLTLDEGADRFSVFAMSQRDLVMAVVDPAGQVHCNDDSYRLHPALTFEAAEAGDYHVFVGGYSAGEGDSFDLYASAGAPAFPGTTVDLDAEPRAGYAAFDMNAAGQGQLLANAPVTSLTPMEVLATGTYCAGHSDISAPDLVMSLDAAQPMISLYALSETDLTIAVRAPDGSWHCNDDALGFNPAVSIAGAQPGDYRIYVGTFSPGAGGMYNLYTSMGQPNWNEAEAGGGAAATELDPGAEPVLGRLSFGPDTSIDPRVIFDIAASDTDAFGMGDGCVGYITPSQPDLVVDTTEGLPQLMVYMVSDADGTLVISGPDGELYCNDDFEGLNPGVMIPNPQPGAYAVFAGTYGGSGGMATLGVTIASPHWVMDREH
ncbi:MAG: hypothetical protein ACK4GT_14370 [Pararhodobacter sp.]